MAIRRLIALILFLTFPLLCESAPPKIHDGFKIIYHVYADNCTQKFLDSAKAWGATGISLEIQWWQVFDGTHWHWYTIDPCIDRICSDSLDVYLRVEFANLPGGLTVNDTDCMTLWDGSLFDPGWKDNHRILNISSDRSRTYFVAFFDSVLDHIASKPDAMQYRFKELLPSFSTQNEYEYDFGQGMLDFSAPALGHFKAYLENKYGTIEALNAAWNSNLSSFESVANRDTLSRWNWNNWVSAVRYTNLEGRVDWLDFRMQEAKSLFDTMARHAHDKGFTIGLQFGSLFDSDIEARGWIDATGVAENADLVINDDIYQYEPQFPFAADYLGSMCTFWNTRKKDGRIRGFGTESNNPGFNHAPADTLCKGWSKQLRQYFQRGARILSISNWTDKDFAHALPSYAPWKQTLLAYKNASIVSRSKTKAIQYSGEMVNFTHNAVSSKTGVYETFGLLSAIAAGYDGKSDILTNTMLSLDTAYVRRYSSGIIYNQSTRYITGKAYRTLTLPGNKSVPTQNKTMLKDPHAVNR